MSLMLEIIKVYPVNYIDTNKEGSIYYYILLSYYFLAKILLKIQMRYIESEID